MNRPEERHRVRLLHGLFAQVTNPSSTPPRGWEAVEKHYTKLGELHRLDGESLEDATTRAALVEWEAWCELRRVGDRDDGTGNLRFGAVHQWAPDQANPGRWGRINYVRRRAYDGLPPDLNPTLDPIPWAHP